MQAQRTLFGWPAGARKAAFQLHLSRVFGAFGQQFDHFSSHMNHSVQHFFEKTPIMSAIIGMLPPLQQDHFCQNDGRAFGVGAMRLEKAACAKGALRKSTEGNGLWY